MRRAADSCRPHGRSMAAPAECRPARLATGRAWEGGWDPHGGQDMNRIIRRALPVLALPLVVAAAACGSDTHGAAPTTTTTPATHPTTPTTPPSTTTPAPDTTITSYKDVQPAVVQIVAKGTFRDPEV